MVAALKITWYHDTSSLFGLLSTGIKCTSREQNGPEMQDKVPSQWLIFLFSDLLCQDHINMVWSTNSNI